MSHARFGNPLWHLIDARGQVVGRLATQITGILRGKHKPIFTPNYDCGDYVVVINAQDVKFTGNKNEDKKYTWHTGFPGGIKHMNVKDQLDKKPEEVLRKAVLGMMKKNIIRKSFSHKLRIFPGDKHTHLDMIPEGTPPINQ
jgi:large subunit ribosomal protein L13